MGYHLYWRTDSWGEKGASTVASSGERTAVLVDPYPLWLDAVENVLAKNAVSVVGRSSNAERALALCEELRPGILVAEPAAGGIACIREACARVPGLKAIALASSDDPTQVQAAFAAGAAAYVVKTAHSDDVGVAIRQAFSPSLFLPGVIPAPSTNGSNGSVPADSHPAVETLTKREREILQLVAEGHSNSQLARMLWVTEQTVKFHLSNIYRKLDVANRTEASRWAQLHGLLEPAPVESMAAEG
jgi:DNA-binding NarL/FixJ family response regulator